MLNQLCFVPKRQPLESMRSVWLRLLSGQGLRSLTRLATHLAVVAPVELAELDALLHGRGALYSAVLRDSPQLVAPWHAAPQFEPRTPAWQRAMLPASARRFCAACAQQGWFDLSFDYAPIVVCHRHGCQLLTACPACQLPLRWDRGWWSHCHCGNDLAQASAAPVADCSGARQVFQLLSEHDDDTLTAFWELYEEVPHLPDPPGDPNDRLNRTARLLQAPHDSLAAALQAGRSACPCLPDRIHLHRWFGVPCEAVKAAAQALVQHAPVRPAACAGHCADLAPLAIRAVSAALGLPRAFLTPAFNAGLLERGIDATTITARSLCQLYRLLAAGSTCARTGPLRPLVDVNNPMNFVRTVRRLRTGDFALLNFDNRLPLTGVHGIDCRAAPMAPVAPEPLMTFAAAASVLQVSVHTLKGVLKLPGMSAPLRDKRTGVHMVCAVEIERFQREFVLLDELCAVLKKRRPAVQAMLKDRGVQPIHSPLINGAKVTVYRREVIAGCAQTAGRATPALRCAEPLPEDAVDFAMATQLLDRPGSALPGLLAAGLLERYPQQPAHRRSALITSWFTRASVLAARKWLDESLPIYLVAAALEVTVDRLRAKVLTPGLVTPVSLGRAQHLHWSQFGAIQQLLAQPRPTRSRAARRAGDPLATTDTAVAPPPAPPIPPPGAAPPPPAGEDSNRV